MEVLTEFLNKLASKGIKLSAQAGRLDCYAQKGALTDEIRRDILLYKPELIALLLAKQQQQNTPTAGGPCLHQLFEVQAALYPKRIAVLCDEEELTYQQLQERSRSLAWLLQSHGVQPDTLVGLCMERSLDVVAGLLGILQSGGAYVPLDPDDPAQRLAALLEDSQVTLVLTQERLLTKLRALAPPNTRIIAVEHTDAIATRGEPQQSVRPHHLAYLMYTAGSTGRQKGVMVEHRHIVSYVAAIQNKLRIPPGSSFALMSTFAADLGHTVLFPSLLGGGTLHVMSKQAMTDPDSFAGYCRKHRIDYMKITPHHLQALLAGRGEACLVPARALVLGGDVVPHEIVQLVRSIHPDCQIYNHYGSTECSVGVLCGEIPIHALTGHSVPLGTPLGESRIYILNPRSELQPAGAVGELCIGGPQVARGYWNQPELTAERFVPDPFHPVPGARMYKSGDLARWLDDGTVEFLGRSDFKALPSIGRVDRNGIERLPLTFAQETLWFLHQLDPGSAVYNLPKAVMLSDEVSFDRWDQAFRVIIARHESLRAVFANRQGQVEQRILDRLDFKLDRVDLSHCQSSQMRDSMAREYCQQQAEKPFDLETGPLLRGALIKLAEREHILMLDMHHIVSDGWSMRILTRELGSIMEALAEHRDPKLAPLPIQYVDYAIWQKGWIEQSGLLKQQLAYWQQKLSGLGEHLDLATDFPRPNTQSFAGAAHNFTLDGALIRRLKELGRQTGATLFMVLLAACKALFHRYTGQHDICVGSLIAGRHHAQTEDLIGMFVNTLALRTWVEGEESFAALLAQVQTTCLEAYEHQEAPFEKVVERLQPHRNPAMHPIFQVMVVLQNTTTEALEQDYPDYPLETRTSQFDLTVGFTETADGLAGRMEYSTALYKPATIARLADHLIGLCGAIVADPETRFCDLEYLGEAEKRQLLVTFNDTERNFPKETLLHELFVAQAKRQPASIALLHGEQTLTYHQLYETSRTLARYLQSCGIGPDQVVGLCMDRSADMLVGMLGILQAGGAYLPLDPAYPQDRLAYMLEDSKAALVLTQEKLEPMMRALMPAGTRLVEIDREWAAIAETGRGIDLEQRVKPNDLAYVIYTSGSTGKPKGVAIEHHSPVTLVYWASEVFSRQELTGVLAATSMCFDLSVFEIFLTLANGGKVIMVANALGLGDLPEDAGVTLINTAPSVMEHLLRMGALPASVVTINLAGEALAAALVDKLYSSTSVKKVYDLYGPSEDTTYSTFCLREKHGAATIGRPIANTQVYMLGAHDQLQAIGVPGELCLGGDGLARGYLHRPDLTQERFVPNPFAPGARMYRTGDLARWTEDGNIQYLGRIDTQVKIRGLRIEPGEIETRLQQHPEIEESVVVAQYQGADKQLVAFYRAKATTPNRIHSLGNEQLRSHLLRTLPDYMVPDIYVSLAAIPSNPSGKVDRRALAAMDVTTVSRRQFVSPRTAAEKQLQQIWAEVLKRSPETIGTGDNFFELGGHSLLAAQLMATLRSRLGVDVPLKALFERPTIAQLAELTADTHTSAMPALRPIDRTELDYFPLSFSQQGLWFISQLEPDTAGYNLQFAFSIKGELNVDQLEQALNLSVARHEILRTVFPHHEGQARQCILDRLDVPLQRFDVSHFPAEEAHQRVREYGEREAGRRFDLASGPLLRGMVIRFAVQEHILILHIHHIISDAWSLDVLMDELDAHLEALAEGISPNLPPLRIQYVDYAVGQRKRLESGGVLEQQLAYWQQKLTGVPESLDLITDYPRPTVQSFAGGLHSFSLDAELTEKLKSLARHKGGTLFMVLLAACKVLLYRYTGQTDLCVGSPIANRQYAGTENLIGMFLNTLALRSQVEADDTYSTVLSRIKALCLEAYEHQEAPFQKVVDVLQPQRSRALSPLFQVMLILHSAASGGRGQRFQPYPIANRVIQFDISLAFMETGSGLEGQIEYSRALYKPETMARMGEHFVGLCRAITATPTARICDLDYLGERERQQVLVEFNRTEAVYPRDRCIHDLFVEQVRRTPHARAVRYGQQELSYGQLLQRSGDLALYLQSLGVKADDVVAVYVERSLEMMVGLMAVELAGGGYLPLDPALPDDRLEYMLQDSGARVVLTQDRLRSRLEPLLLEGVTVVGLDKQWAGMVQAVAGIRSRGTELRPQARPEHMSYLIYTSGTTGKPKGVAVEHRALVNRIHWMQTRYALGQDDVVLQKTPYGFDVSVWEFFWPMMAGASLVFAAPDGHKDVAYLEGLIEQEQVTTLHFVPSMLRNFVETAGGRCGSVRQIFSSGEALDRATADLYRDKFPHASLHNLYGPTEAAIDVTAYDCSQLQGSFVPIGRPIDNTQIYILDAHENPQPIGIAGELYIAGDGLARGYVNRKELTREKFVANPFCPGTRMYKTGDRARWMDDGNIQYLGRIDTQVKIRGFRVELGEIEARLNQHPEVMESTVVAQGPEGNQRLIAFYRAKGSLPERLVDLPFEGLRAHLAQTLPEYMVPSACVSLAAIPLSANGKVDRHALERKDVKMRSGRAYVAPATDVERDLVAIWADVLKLAPETIGVNDSFFELGGHSLLATQLVAKIRRHFDIDMPLKALFEHTHVAGLAGFLGGATKSKIPRIVPGDRSLFARLPLSPAQERLWFLDQLEPGSGGYNIAGALILRGEMAFDRLQQAFDWLIARHENLRTIFPSEEGQAWQRILQKLDFGLEFVDISHHPSDEKRHALARKLCQTDAEAPFDLARGPLLRGKVIKLKEQEHVLLLNMHHIISDGWSIGILVRELGIVMEAFRRGRQPELPPLPIQYVDYSMWQERLLSAGGVLQQQLAYWQTRLAGAADTLDLPTDFPRPAVQSLAGATHAITLDARLTQRLKSLAAQQGCTLYMVLLSVFKVLLYRYTGQQDMCVGTPIANRQYGETQGLIGMFVNTLALRSQIAGEDTFLALLAQIKTTCVEAFDHQDAPFERVVDAVQPERNLAASPLFQVMLTLQNDERPLLTPGMEFYPFEVGVSKFDLSVDLTEEPDGITGRIEYRTALHKPETIARIAKHFVALCQAATAQPMQRICDLEYLSAEETRRLLVMNNDTRADFPQEKCIHQLFAEQVRTDPDRIAIVCDGQELSYQELYDRSRDLALSLQHMGVEPDSIVGLYVDRSLDLIVGLLGILQAGGAYLPLDPEYPAERLSYMVADSQAGIILTRAHLQVGLSALAGDHASAVILDGDRLQIDDRSVRLREDVQSHHAAYVIYTSGSTGKPKGVVVEHRSLVNHNTFARKHYRAGKDDIQVLCSSISFDLFAEEVFVALTCGAKLLIEQKEQLLTPSYLERLIESRKITTLNVPTAFFHELVGSGIDVHGLKTLIVGGEALSHAKAALFTERFPAISLHNTYGPTEATIISTAVRVTQDLLEQHSSVPIGAPIANTQIYVLDSHGYPQPVGIPGELHIAGDGLARGYLGRWELTQEKFVANPFVKGTRMYKTGDRARWLEDGNLEYLGRCDTQVKVRGFRIETGEIESCLNQHQAIQESAVIAMGEETDKRLIAFYRANDTQPDRLVQLPLEELRKHLMRTLPEYMVPVGFVSLAAIPLSPNGKVDRKELGGMQVAAGADQNYAAPRNDTEKRLVTIWSEVLKLPEEAIGINSNFFELGGHSLSTVRLMAKIQRQFSKLLPLTVVFTNPSVAALAELVTGDKTASFAMLVPIQTEGDALPIFGVPGAGGNVSLQPLRHGLGARQPFYGLQAAGLEGDTTPHVSVEQTAHAYVAAIKTMQPTGPYRLIGHSYGGVVAYAMAGLLLQQGEEVSALVLLDSVAPSVMQGEERKEQADELLEACTVLAQRQGATLQMDMDRLRCSSRAENVEYAVSLLNACGLEIDGAQFAAFYRVYEADLEAYRAYRPSPLTRTIDVSLYRATQGKPPDYGWSELLQDPLRVCDVDADHFSILEKVVLAQLTTAG